ncbi:hypothetical protein DERP_006372 [Dermatophagoides pteronyssinus]|uniref:Uncharacterized protein n=1 Tax=Dermatophagoides pteronyssinus TaxID=6956 RepID=A0ABQ8IY86_DERPT|nr:hypothetical protein DERP_006372 [Dermatophagoides pteronyssinus]
MTIGQMRFFQEIEKKEYSEYENIDSLDSSILLILLSILSSSGKINVICVCILCIAAKQQTLSNESSGSGDSWLCSLSWFSGGDSQAEK